MRTIVDLTAAAITRFFKLYADRGIERERARAAGEEEHGGVEAVN